MTKSRAPQQRRGFAEAAKTADFSVQAFLDSAWIVSSVAEYRRGEAVFAQGDVCDDVMYIRSGTVKLSVLSKTGKEAVVAMLGPGHLLR